MRRHREYVPLDERWARSAGEEFPVFACHVVGDALRDDGYWISAVGLRRFEDASLEGLSYAFALLSRCEYRAVRLRYAEGRSQSEISAALGISQPTVSRPNFRKNRVIL